MHHWCRSGLIWLAGLLVVCARTSTAGEQQASNLIPNGDFQHGQIGQLPTGWSSHAYRPALTPRFSLAQHSGSSLLEIDGVGNPNCVGYVSTKVPIVCGQSYRFEVIFKVSPGLNPHEHLLFQCFGPGGRDGIFDLHLRDDGWIEGAATLEWAGSGAAEAEVRILFRLAAEKKAWIRHIGLVETASVEPRWVTFACTQGRTDRESCRAVLEAVGRHGVDVVLLPEYAAGDRIEETLPGPSSKLMAEMAQRHRMYVAGGIVRKVVDSGLVYNTALLYDREGKLVGTYDKLHPYSPEVNEQGITPGNRVPVLKTDFGNVGFIICYDSWFSDVAQLAALKGAEILLFPNAGYYRSLMPARAADNRVRVVCSTWNNEYGIWDTVGRDVLRPQADRSHKPVHGTTFKDVQQLTVGEIKVLIATLDLNCSPSPAYNGGTMFEAPGGRRNRGDQKVALEGRIQRHRQRWWIPQPGQQLLEIPLRRRTRNGKQETSIEPMDPRRTAVVVVDMWSQGGHGYLNPDGTFDGTAEGYFYQEHVTKAINHTLAAARALGMQVVFAPSGQTQYYKDRVVRKNVLSLPHSQAPWQGKLDWNPEQLKIPFAEYRDGYEYRYPGSPLRVTRPGTKSWGQNPNLVLMDEDMMTEDADELWNIVRHLGIARLVYMGGATNMCLPGRPFGLLNMKERGIDVILDRHPDHVVHRIPHGWNGDRADPQFGPQYSTERNARAVIDHFERHICPTMNGMILRKLARQRVGRYDVPSAAVEEVLADPANIKINFSPQHIEVPDGYLIDCGSVSTKHANGLTYGWRRSHLLETCRRVYDPLKGAFCFTLDDATWEIELDDGEYEVTVAVGDLKNPAAEQTIRVEGITFCEQAVLSTAPTCYTKTVNVQDGRLTINNRGADSRQTAIVYLHIRRI